MATLALENGGAPAPANALSIDVEDWYHDESRGTGAATPEEIAAVEPRVERNVAALFELLATSGTTATFFFLAEVAARAPRLVREAVSLGHEVACHGYRHRPVGERSPAELRDDVVRARAVLEDRSGVAVRGFRAPCFVRDPRDLWALDVVAAAGFAYDSSYMPLRFHPGAPPLLGDDIGPVRLPSGLWEFPLPLSRLPTGHVLPCAAGGFALRALPLAFTRHYLRRYNREVGPAVVYTHPWEIDPASPKLPGTRRHVRFFNGVGRSSMRAKLARLLAEFRFVPLADAFARELSSSPAAEPPTTAPGRR